MSAVDFWPMAHGVAEIDEDMQALLLGAAAAVGHDAPVTQLRKRLGDPAGLRVLI